MKPLSKLSIADLEAAIRFSNTMYDRNTISQMDTDEQKRRKMSEREKCFKLKNECMEELGKRLELTIVR